MYIYIYIYIYKQIFINITTKILYKHIWPLYRDRVPYTQIQLFISRYSLRIEIYLFMYLYICIYIYIYIHIYIYVCVKINVWIYNYIDIQSLIYRNIQRVISLCRELYLYSRCFLCVFNDVLIYSVKIDEDVYLYIRGYISI